MAAGKWFGGPWKCPTSAGLRRGPWRRHGGRFGSPGGGWLGLWEVGFELPLLVACVHNVTECTPSRKQSRYAKWG
jgi:hypothetical protein